MANGSKAGPSNQGLAGKCSTKQLIPIGRAVSLNSWHRSLGTLLTESTRWPLLAKYTNTRAKVRQFQVHGQTRDRGLGTGTHEWGFGSGNASWQLCYGTATGCRGDDGATAAYGALHEALLGQPLSWGQNWDTQTLNLNSARRASAVVNRLDGMREV